MKIKVAVAVILAIAMAAALSVAQENKGAATLTITVKEKGDVNLPHSKHQELLKDCKVCHDAFPQKTGAINEFKAAGKLQKKQVMNTQCIKCHNEKKNAGMKSGPVTCSACHK